MAGDRGALERRTLGRTGLDVTVIGFGAGGFSRAGMADGIDHASEVIAAALDAGVNLVDTAEMYRTEEAVAAGIARSSVSREDVVITTKVDYRERDGERLRARDELEAAIDARFAALGTESRTMPSAGGDRDEGSSRLAARCVVRCGSSGAAGRVDATRLTRCPRADERRTARAIQR